MNKTSFPDVCRRNERREKFCFGTSLKKNSDKVCATYRISSVKPLLTNSFLRTHTSGFNYKACSIPLSEKSLVFRSNRKGYIGISNKKQLKKHFEKETKSNFNNKYNFKYLGGDKIKSRLMDYFCMLKRENALENSPKEVEYTYNPYFNRNSRSKFSINTLFKDKIIYI